MQNPAKPKIEPPASSLGRLEEYLEAGDVLGLLIERPALRLVDSDWTRPRFIVSEIDHGTGEQTGEAFTGNTLASCLLNLVASLERARPITDGEFLEIANRLANGHIISGREREKFIQYAHEMTVTID